MHMNDIFCGIANAITVITVGATISDPALSLIFAIISSIVYAVINIGVHIITSVLEKKGLISGKHKEEIDDVADDISDDGKRNGSNH